MNFIFEEVVEGGLKAKSWFCLKILEIASDFGMKCEKNVTSDVDDRLVDMQAIGHLPELPQDRDFLSE